MTWRQQLWARTSVDVLLAEMAGEHRLRRRLGPVSLTALGIGAIIGAGGCTAFADPDAGLAFGYVTSQLRFDLTGDRRSRGLVRAVYASL